MRTELFRARLNAAIRQTLRMAIMLTALGASASEAFGQDNAAGGLPVSGRTDVLHQARAPVHAAARREGIRLGQRLASPPQAPDRDNRRWMSRHPILVGALIGTGGGAVLSRTTAVGGGNHDPRVTLIGTAAGTWGGLIASAVQKARAKEPVGIGTKIGIVAGAVGAIVLPLVACYGAGGCGGVS